MSKRTPSLLLEDIIDAANKIMEYTKELSFEDFRVQHDGVDWHRIRGFRNRIVHEYFGVDLQILWNIKENHILQLIEDIMRLQERI